MRKPASFRKGMHGVQVEMLLEAYFMQVDNTCNKLQTLHEYIDDTEVSPLKLHSSKCIGNLRTDTLWLGILP